MDFDLFDMYAFNKRRQQGSFQPQQPAQPAQTNNVVGFGQPPVSREEDPNPQQPLQPPSQSSQAQQPVFKVKKSTKHPDEIKIGGDIEYYSVNQNKEENKVNEPVENEPVENEPVKNEPVENEPAKEGNSVENEPVKEVPKQRGKKPPTAYQLFVRENIGKLSGPSKGRMKKLGQMWKQQSKQQNK